MLTLHLAFHARQFLFWAETPLAQAPTAESSNQAYPYAAPEKELHRVIQELELSQNPSALHHLPYWLWVPSKLQDSDKDSRAEASSASAPLNAQQHTLKLKAWHVQCIKLPPGKLMRWLTQCGHQLSPLAGVTHSTEIAVWQQLLRLAVGLVWQQRILPDLKFRSEHWEAEWFPVLSQTEHLQLSQLAQAMPAVSQALSPSQEEKPMDRGRAQLLEALYYLCDALVRQEPVGEQRGVRLRHQSTAETHWLKALRKRSGRMPDHLSGLELLQERIHYWQQDIRYLAEAAFQFILQLEEPNENSEGWFIRFLLQSRDDPSLYIPCELLQAAPEQLPERLRAGLPQARAFVSLALHRLSEHCLWLEPESAARNGGQDLSLAQVEHFLQHSEELSQAGFGLHLPRWWVERGPRLTSNASFSAQSGSGKLGLNTLVDVDWNILLEGQSISLNELQELAEMKSELVQWRGRWVKLDHQELKQALSFWQKHASGGLTVQDLLRLGPSGEAMPIHLEHWQVDQLLNDFLAALQGLRDLPEALPPQSFQGDLRHYQQRGLDWLQHLSQYGLGACLADDMGLGKTVQSLALLARMIEQGETRPVLLVCPTSLLSNWYREARRFVPDIKVWVHHGADRLKDKALFDKLRDTQLLITTYALTHRDRDQLKEVPWSGVILDEAQNVKNPQTKQSRAVRQLQADWRLALTGTPVENHVGELWSLMDFLNPGLLGYQQNFKREFLTPIQRWQDETALKQLKQLTQPFILRRSKSDPTILPELPEKLEYKVYCTLSTEQASLYAAVIQELEHNLSELSGMRRRGLILSTLSRLKQICNHPLHFLKEKGNLRGRSGKLMRLEEMLEEILSLNEKALVFTQFAALGHLLQPYLSERFERPVLFLHGGTPAKAREKLVDRFQQDEAVPLFLLSLKAGGTGLNLTAANHVFHFDRWWNPAVENQATDRVYRIGQTRNVQVHKMICTGTLEERIDEMLEEKQQLADQIIGGGENWITELSDNEIRQLFQLNLELVS